MHTQYLEPNSDWNPGSDIKLDNYLTEFQFSHSTNPNFPVEWF